MEITAKELMQLVEDRIEPAEPQTAILEYLKKYEGKLLTQNHIRGLQAALNNDSIRISKRYGYTNIVWDGNHFDQTHGLQIARSEKNVRINIAEILEENAGYFGAREERNEQRQTLLKKHHLFIELARTLNAFHAAQENLKTALNGMECETNFLIYHFGLDARWMLR